jgi:hypothetical protein
MSQMQSNQLSASKQLVVEYHVRGRRKRHALTTYCQTVQDIIDLGERSFPAFAERNPWICIDSKHAVAFVGIDPERQRGGSGGTNSAVAETARLKEE